MSDFISNGTNYIKALNPIQRQMLVEIGVDYLWGESLAFDAQKVVKATSQDTALKESTSASPREDSNDLDSQQQPVIAAATKEAVNAHANEARKMLQKARHRTVSSVPTTTSKDSQQLTSEQTAAVEPKQNVTANSDIKKADRSTSTHDLKTMSWQALTDLAQTIAAEASLEQRVVSVFEDKSEGHQCDWLFLDQLSILDAERYGPAMTKQAQTLFAQMMFALGLERSDVAVLPLLMAHDSSADNKDKQQLTIAPVLLEQINRLQPKCIVAFGDAAASLLQVDKGLLALIRRELNFQHPELGLIPVVATFSPYYLLLNSENKAQTWQDLKRARRITLT